MPVLAVEDRTSPVRIQHMQREIVIGDEHPKGKIVDIPGRMQGCGVDIATQVDGTVVKIHVFVAKNTPINLWSTQTKSPFLLCSYLLRNSCGRRDGPVRRRPAGWRCQRLK